jgi:Uncharacterised nucleotidyltransferase
MIASVATDLPRRIAGYGLPGTTLTFPEDVLDGATWDATLAAVARERITGHLTQAIHDGVFPVTADQQAACVDAHERALALALLLERLLLTKVAQLDAVKIPTRVLRGPAVAHAVYPDPAFRSFGDVDLLVGEQDYDAALAMFCAHGARRRYPEPRPGFDRRFGKGVCLETPAGLEIDVHRRLVAGPFGLAVDSDELFESSTTFSLGGYELQALDPEARFLDACFHAALGGANRRLLALRDVAQMALCSPLDVARVRRLCREWRCGIVVRRAIGLAWDAFMFDATPEVVRWACVHEATRFERQALDAYVGADRSYARQAVAGLQALQRFRDKAAYAASLLVPTRRYIRAREGTYLRRGRRAVRLLFDDHSARRRQASGARAGDGSLA